MNLQNKYSRDEFLNFISSFIPNFSKDIRKVDTRGLKTTTEAFYLGESSDLDLAVFELTHTSSSDARVTLATEGFKLMKDSSNFRALIAYIPERSNDWRLSLMTATPDTTEKGRVILKLSNPRRYSFFLGENAKINTPHQFLIKQGGVTNFDELQKRFSLEVVNKEFYKEISESFIKLVGGTLGTGKGQKKYEPVLKLPSTDDHSQTSLEFAVRLIGRIIFCWFLREKKSEAGLSLMPKGLLSLDATNKYDDYYHAILEPIFFEVLNKPIKTRRDGFSKKPFSNIPYLNGGLFSPQDEDYYRRSNGDLQSQFHNTLVIPDNWFKDFFETLETYNFTIDENTSFDEELSIDPEMLGRIFENLLAEINPETGESARKNTGSYYTPRNIVNYMVDESLLLYLKEQTKIDEKKLRAIISYDLEDDAENTIVPEEQEKIIEALEKIKILDPACGSGAFPIGALQKIVFILQQTDPDGQLWFKKQLRNTPHELRKRLEKEHQFQNFDYIRKMGVIRENIYGVDIQPVATEISRLRCFLTLIVDQYIKDEEDNRGIIPLPNLDFKFVTANSLIGLPKNSGNQPLQPDMFDDQTRITELKELRDQYFTATGEERLELMHKFSDLQKVMYKELVKEHGFAGPQKAELTDKLTDWSPFKHTSTPWFDPEWMFGIKEGFDIVIANPPYITIRNQPKELRGYLRKNFIYSGGADLYVAFIEKSFSLINSQGIIVFICPNKFFGADYGKKLREELKNGGIKIQSIWDLKDVRVFTALITTVVIVFKRASSEKTIIKNDTGIHNLNIFDNRNKIQLEQDNVNRQVIEKIEANKKLTFYGNLRTGIMGFEYWKMAPIIKESGSGVRLLTNGNIDQFVDKWGEKEIALYKNKYLKPKIELSSKYLNNNTIKLFKSKKIIIRGVAKRLTACIDNIGSGLLVAVHSFIPNNSKYTNYLLGLLNSNLLNWHHLHTFYSVRIPQGSLKYPIDCLTNLPIPDPSDHQEKFKQLSNLVDRILRSDVEKAELIRRLNTCVYELYELTDEEIKIVEGEARNAT